MCSTLIVIGTIVVETNKKKLKIKERTKEKVTNRMKKR